jgi:hypothetical protein
MQVNKPCEKYIAMKCLFIYWTLSLLLYLWLLIINLSTGKQEEKNTQIVKIYSSKEKGRFYEVLG